MSRIKQAIKFLLYGPKLKMVPYLKRFKVVNDSKIDFWITDEEAKIWYDHGGERETPETAMLAKLIEPHFHVVEIGVHYGFVASFISTILGAKGRYLGVELMPQACVNALAQLKTNNAGNNFQIINAAAGNENGHVTFTNMESGNGSVNSSGDGIKIQQITGDSLLGKMDGKIDFIKIDVEGYEVKVLEGCKELLKQRPNISLEIHAGAIERYGDKVERIFEMINLENYDATFFCNSNSGDVGGLGEPFKLRKFNVQDMPKADNMNLFLVAKKQ